MNNKFQADTLYREEESLLMVRQWKEQIYQETKDLSPSERTAKLRAAADDLKAKYGLKLLSLQSASRS